MKLKTTEMQDEVDFHGRCPKEYFLPGYDVVVELLLGFRPSETGPIIFVSKFRCDKTDGGGELTMRCARPPLA